MINTDLIIFTVDKVYGELWPRGRGGGGTLGIFLGGMCCWDPATLNLYQS